MLTLRHVGLVLVSALALLVSAASAEEPALARSRPSERRPRPPRGSRQTPPVTPATPVQQAAPADSPPAAVLVQCDEGPDCQVVISAAESAASRRYRLVGPAEQAPVWASEPALRGCRREKCLAVIADKLKVTRLIQVIIQRSKKHKGIDATFVLFCSEAGQVCNDSFKEDFKREEAKLRKNIESTVEELIAYPRPTAPLRLEVKPVGAAVTILREGTVVREVEIRDDKPQELRLLTGVYTVRLSKPGYIEKELTVTVSQVGATVPPQQLQTRPVEVKFEWSPPGSKLLVDGEAVDPRIRAMELPEGKHEVQVLAPQGSSELYEPLREQIEVQMGMAPVRLVLQRRTELRIRAPRGYTISIDNKLKSPEDLRPQGLFVEVSERSPAGTHTVSAVSWRGLQLTSQVEVLPRTTADVQLNPPSLVPGAVIGTIGALGIIAGGVLLAFDGKPTDSRDVLRYDFLTPAVVTMSVGGAALLTGAIWFGRNAANHPLFYKPGSPRSSALPSRVSLLPRVGAGYAGVLSTIQF